MLNHQQCCKRFSRTGQVLFQRAFSWDPKYTRLTGKPAITGSKSVFVSRHIPVVLLADVSGIGQVGSIVHVLRGYARTCLVPQGLAVYGTTWENIDAFASNKYLPKKPKQIAAKKEIVEDKAHAVAAKPRIGRSKNTTFQWIDDICLKFMR